MCTILAGFRSKAVIVVGNIYILADVAEKIMGPCFQD
jgi:hypothetical protein